MNNKKNLFGVLALVATGIGFGASLLSDWVNNKQQEELIQETVKEEVSKALAEREEETEES